MHPNPTFRTKTSASNLSFVRENSFGTLSVNGPDGPLVSHIPFLLNAQGSEIELHLVRSNPIVRLLNDPRPAVLAVTGPHSYISPDWYRADDMVPTWNYVAVHLRGTLEQRPANELRGTLDRLSAHFETQLDKTPWVMDKMSEDALTRMLRQIIPFRLMIEDVQGTWKLGQNKPGDARLSAAGEVEEGGIGQDLRELADLMRDPGEN